MTSVKVDLGTMFGDITRKLPGPKDVDKMLTALGAAARAEWISQASDNLKGTARDYIQGLSEVEIKGRVATIRLVGVLPNMVENGWGPHDLRETLLHSAKAKVSKDGHRYMSIPFRHGTPGSGGSNVGKPMPKPIHNVAKHLMGTYHSSQVKMPGERLSLNSKMGRGARKILESKEKSWHSTSIYMGMIRKVDAMPAALAKGGGMKEPKTTGYQTFRTISDGVKNDARHWMHPGIDAKHLATKVQDMVRKVAPKIIGDASK